MHSIFKDSWSIGEYRFNNSSKYDVQNIATMGSCFARNFSRWLEFNNLTDSSQPWDILYNPFSIFNEINRLYIAYNTKKHLVKEKTQEGKIIYRDPTRTWIKGESIEEVMSQNKVFDSHARNHLEKSSTLIITLGLTEVWYNKKYPKFFLNQVPLGALNINRSSWRSKFLSVVEVENILLKINKVLNKNLPNLKIVYTVSPVPLKYTASSINIRRANNLSKSTLICAINNLSIKNKINYFPSLEIVQAINETECVWHADGRHINANVIEKVCMYFLVNFTKIKIKAPKKNYYVPFVSKEGVIVGKQYSTGEIVYESTLSQE